MTMITGAEAEQIQANTNPMPGFKLALEPTSFDGALKVAGMVAKIGMCGVKSPEEALIRIAAGRELGI